MIQGPLQFPDSPWQGVGCPWTHQPPGTDSKGSGSTAAHLPGSRSCHSGRDAEPGACRKMMCITAAHGNRPQRPQGGLCSWDFPGASAPKSEKTAKEFPGLPWWETVHGVGGSGICRNPDLP